VTEISRPTAEALVQARLGRSPQDLYEAAVVLEAWGGVPGPSALSMGRELMTVSRLRWPSPEHRHQRAEIPPGLLPEALALLVTVSVLALWAPALAAELGRSAVEVALWVALPLALGLQWAVRSRYLSSPEGFAALAADRRQLATLVLPIVVLPGLVLGVAGALAGLLIVTCLGGLIVAARGWGVRYAACLGLVGSELLLGVPPFLLVVEAGLGTFVAVVVALWTVEKPVVRPRPWRRAAGSGLVGLGLGALFLGDPSVQWGHDVIGALALLPPAVGGIWGGLTLAALWTAVPGAVSGVAPSNDRRTLVGPCLFLAASIRLVATTIVLSLVLAAIEFLLVHRVPDPGTVLAFACLGLAVLAVSLLDALGLAAWAVVAVMGGAAAELGSSSLGLTGLPAGTALAAGAAAVLVVALPRALVALMRPGRLLATTLSIP
jgi:hypothetical protein